MTELPTYILEREFEAPIDLVWKTWTDPSLLAKWFGPRAETTVHRMDLKPGGHARIEMRWGSKSNFQRFEYVEVLAPKRLVWLHATTDADWNIMASPMMPDWPRLLLTTVTFAQQGKRTKVRLTWVPHEATAAEIACFATAISGLDKGWGSGMDLLATILEELQR